MLTQYDIDKLKDSTTFGNFFNEYVTIMEKEKKNLPY